MSVFPVKFGCDPDEPVEYKGFSHIFNKEDMSIDTIDSQGNIVAKYLFAKEDFDIDDDLPDGE